MRRDDIVNLKNKGYDVVFINHKKIANTRTFEILKINNKNIKVRDRDDNSLLTVSPSLLSK